MGSNEFAQGLVEVLLSWMRLVTSWVWNFFQADMANGFLSWFADNWKGIAIFLIVVGVVIDWLIWMIRWRPYWLWLRKRQIIYEEVPARRAPRRAQSVRHMPRIDADEPDDPFAENESDPYAALSHAAEPANASDSEFGDWDASADPYAVDRSRHADYDPSIYARPVLGEQKSARTSREYPVLSKKEN